MIILYRNGYKNFGKSTVEVLKDFIITYFVLVLPLIIFFDRVVNLENNWSFVSLIISLVYVFIITKGVDVYKKSISDFVLEGSDFFKSFIMFSLVITLFYTFFVWLNYGFAGIRYVEDQTGKILVLIATVSLIVLSIFVMIKRFKTNGYVTIFILMLLLSLYTFALMGIDNIYVVHEYYQKNRFDVLLNDFIYRVPNVILWLFVILKCKISARENQGDYMTKVLFFGYVGAVYQIIYIVIFGLLPMFFSLMANLGA